jgi:hypothetical protein
MTKRPKTAVAQLKVRLRETLRAQLEKSAKQHGLSLNAEIAKRLDQSFEWERAFAEPKKMIEQDFLAAMLQKGFQRLFTKHGVIWTQTEIKLTDLLRSVEATALVRAIEPELAVVVAKAIAKVANRGNEE